MSKCYRIVGWNERFEVNRTRELKRLDWLPLPIELGSDGYAELIEREHGPAMYGVWIAIVQVAARCKNRTGELVRDNGQPHTAESLARQIRMPLELVSRTLDVCTRECNWLEINVEEEVSREGAEIPQADAQMSHKGALEEIREEEKREEKTREDKRRYVGHATDENSREVQPVRDTNSEYCQVTDHLVKRVLECRKPKLTDAKLAAWDREARLMCERDGWSVPDMIALIDECHDMPPRGPACFTWRDNILSMGSLRQRAAEGKIYLGMLKAAPLPPQNRYGRQELTREQIADSLAWIPPEEREAAQ